MKIAKVFTESWVVRNLDQLMSRMTDWLFPITKTYNTEQNVAQTLNSFIQNIVPVSTETLKKETMVDNWWVDFFWGESVHVYPENDKYPHDLHSKFCRCNPKLTRNKEDTLWILVHRSFDFREYEEKDNKHLIH